MKPTNTRCCTDSAASKPLRYTESGRNSQRRTSRSAITSDEGEGSRETVDRHDLMKPGEDEGCWMANEQKTWQDIGR